MVLAVFIGYELCMGALLDNCALVEYCDLVAEFATGQAVADIDCGLVTGDVIELCVDLRLCNWF